MAGLQQFQEVQATIKTRDIPGIEKKPGVDALDGVSGTFSVMWPIDDGIYRGEFAMGPVSCNAAAAMAEVGLAWIASGDLIIK